MAIFSGGRQRARSQSLDFDPGERRLGDLGPPQKTRQLNKRGRTLKVTIKLLVKQALERSIPLQVVVGSAPGWSDPWSRGQLAFVEKEPAGWRAWIVDEGGYVIDEGEIQRARLADPASISS